MYYIKRLIIALVFCAVSIMPQIYGMAKAMEWIKDNKLAVIVGTSLAAYTTCGLALAANTTNSYSDVPAWRKVFCWPAHYQKERDFERFGNAARKGNVGYLKDLFLKRYSPQEWGAYKATQRANHPLVLAVGYGKIDFVKELLQADRQNKIDPRVKQDALAVAINQGSKEVFDCLLESGTRPLFDWAQYSHTAQRSATPKKVSLYTNFMMAADKGFVYGFEKLYHALTPEEKQYHLAFLAQSLLNTNDLGNSEEDKKILKNREGSLELLFQQQSIGIVLEYLGIPVDVGATVMDARDLV